MSSTANSVPPYVFESKGTFPAPFTFDVPASLEVRPDTATARFDGSGASGDFLACLTFYGSDGERLGRWFNPTVLHEGDVAEVTYTPPFGSAATSAAPSGSVVEEEELGAATIAIPAADFGSYSQVHASGAVLTDLTVPTAPLLLADGLYTISWQIFIPGGGAIANPPTGYMRGFVSNSAGILAGQTETMETVSSGGGSLTMSATRQMSAGDDLTATVYNDIPATTQILVAQAYLTIAKLPT